MEAKLYERMIKFLVAITFFLIFFSLKVYAGDYPNQPTDQQYIAFLDLYLGEAQWPVWKIEGGQIEVDGFPFDPAWHKAQKIFITGQWMWNEGHINKIRYCGLKDFIAVWRLLYDEQNLYILCEFFDDKHVEGDGTEPWYYNDAIDMNLILPIYVMAKAQGIGQPSTAFSFMRIFRRFTRTQGLAGNINGVRYPDISTYGWAKGVEEGSDLLGGIKAAAHPITDSGVTYKFPGAWAMEMKIPLATAAQYLGMPLGHEGQRFKMNLTICDDDNTTRNYDNADEEFLSIGMHRYPVWWGDNYWNMDPTLAEMAFAPTFMLMGYSKDDTPDGFYVPDEFNLYCGHTPEFYQSITTNLYTSPSGNYHVGIRINQQSGFKLYAMPNPLVSVAQLHFNLVHQAQAHLQIFNIQGTLIRDYGDKDYTAGKHVLLWNATDDNGNSVAPGNYIINMRADNRQISKTIKIVK
jgi:hypothetical protein